MKTFEKYISVGSIALITGASSGMGLEYCRQLAASGCQLIMVSNQAEQLQNCAEELRTQFHVKIWDYFLDLSLDSAADELFNFCTKNGLNVDILINNAGIFFFKELQGEICIKAETMLRLHIFTPTRLSMLFGNEMKKRGYGYILNVSSIVSSMSVPGLTMYASTKAYLRTFSRSLYYEMKPYGVSVTTLCPGAVDTSLYSVLPSIQKLFKIGKKLGMVYTPEKLVRKGLTAMFHHSYCTTPGLINFFFPKVINLIPSRAVVKIWKKLSKNV